MNLKDYPGINQQRKEKILGMSNEELMIEIEKGPKSIMPKCIPYMKAVLHSRNAENEESQREIDLAYNQAMLEEAQTANQVSTRAYRLSKWAIFISIVAIVVTLVTNK